MAIAAKRKRRAESSPKKMQEEKTSSTRNACYVCRKKYKRGLVVTVRIVVARAGPILIVYDGPNKDVAKPFSFCIFS